MRPIKTSIASLALALLLAEAVAATSHTRISTDPKDAAYVGQYVNVTVEVLSPGAFAGAPTFDLPDVEGGVILQLDSQGTHGSETVDGQSWHVVNYSFALFPQRRGACSLPPIGLRFAADSGIEPMQTEPVRIEATMPEGAETLSALVSTPALTVKEKWSPDVVDCKVGDAITRTITMTAESVLGMGFPPLTFQKVEGLGLYPQNPTVDDYIHRGDFTGTRIESATYICEGIGKYALPAIRIPWFDLSAKELKTVELDGRVIKVAANPQLEGGAPARGAARRGLLLIPLLAIGLVALAAATAWRFRSRLKHACEAARRRHQESEPVCFQRFLRAARSGSLAATLNSLLLWLDCSGFVRDPATVSALCARARDAELTTLLGGLTDAMYRGDDGAWSDGAKLASVVKRARKRLMQDERSAAASDPHRLVPLNPDGGINF